MIWSETLHATSLLICTDPFSIIFASVKSMRYISPFFSALLIVLVLSGTMGFTYMRHTCYHCGSQSLVTSFTASGSDDKCCCGHDKDIESPDHNTGEFIFSHDCCSIETERMIAVQVIRTEVQPEIIPYFPAATSLTIIPDQDLQRGRLFPNNMQMHDGRDLMTMHCQILS